MADKTPDKTNKVKKPAKVNGTDVNCTLPKGKHVLPGGHKIDTTDFGNWSAGRKVQMHQRFPRFFPAKKANS